MLEMKVLEYLLIFYDCRVFRFLWKYWSFLEILIVVLSVQFILFFFRPKPPVDFMMHN